MTPLLASLTWLSSAHAAGVLVAGNGQLLGGPTESEPIAQVRALLAEQADGHVTTVVQAAVDRGNIGSAWLIPITGELVMEPVTAHPALLDELLRATDPYYEDTLSNCTSGCTSAVGETGVLAEVRYFDEGKASASWSHFGPDNTDDALALLDRNGFAVDNSLAADLTEHASAGGSLVVVWFNGDQPYSASPAVAVRARSTSRMLPQAITGYNAESEVQTVVLTVGEAPASPTGAVTTTPILGQPLYQPDETPGFYQARVRVAIDQAGGDAWVLEYNNTLSSLKARRRLLQDDLLWDKDEGHPWGGLWALKQVGILDDFDESAVWVTRWRTIQSPDQLRDQVFETDDLGAYEVYVEASEYANLNWLFAVPIGLLGWAARRRRSD